MLNAMKGSVSHECAGEAAAWEKALIIKRFAPLQWAGLARVLGADPFVTHPRYVAHTGRPQEAGAARPEEQGVLVLKAVRTGNSEAD